MRITKDNIDVFLDKNGDLILYNNQEITHIDYIPDNLTWLSISHSNVEQITCKLPDGLKYFYCYKSKLRSLPLLPKSLITFDSTDSNLPKEYQVVIWGNNIQCNNLRKIQLLELI